MRFLKKSDAIVACCLMFFALWPVARAAAPDFRQNPSGATNAVGGNLFHGYADAYTRITGSVTLDDTYRGLTIIFDSSSAGTITLPSNLPAGFNVTVLQINTGQVTMAAGSGAVLQSRQGFSKTAGQWAMIGITAYDQGSYVMVGDGA